jgi:hypothetical protein
MPKPPTRTFGPLQGVAIGATIKQEAAIRFENAIGGGMVFDQYRAPGPAAQGFETDRPRTREKVEELPVFEFAAQHVEKRLPHFSGGGSREIHAGRRFKHHTVEGAAGEGKGHGGKIGIGPKPEYQTRSYRDGAVGLYCCGRAGGMPRRYFGGVKLLIHWMEKRWEL